MSMSKYHINTDDAGKRHLTCNQPGPFEVFNELGAGAALEWDEQRLSVITFDSTDEPAVMVQFNLDGSVASIKVRSDLRSIIYKR